MKNKTMSSNKSPSSGDEISVSSSTPISEPISNVTSSSEVILTEVQKAELWADRVKKFNEGLTELQKKHKLEVKAQITPDGPIISLIPKE